MFFLNSRPIILLETPNWDEGGIFLFFLRMSSLQIPPSLKSLGSDLMATLVLFFRMVMDPFVFHQGIQIHAMSVSQAASLYPGTVHTVMILGVRKPLWWPEVTPWKINGWNIIIGVWFRSFSFLFMGDGCRFQPFIFQGVLSVYA